jgi:pyruvate dehydrogenase E2 component (dihydrolipoamide acetyltransferase)
MYIPDLGGATDVEVIELSVAVGDTVSEGDSLIVLETDKASMEIPADQDGTITVMHVTLGDSCNQGDPLLDLTTVKPIDDQSDISPEATSTLAPEPTVAEPVAVSNEGQAPTAKNEPKTVRVPELGGLSNVEVIEVAVQIGAELLAGDVILVLETDKASMEIPSPCVGQITELLVQEGAQINEGDPIAIMNVAEMGVLESPEQQTQPMPKQSLKQQAQAMSQASVQPALTTKTAQAHADHGTLKSVYAGPAVRMLARKLGVDLTQVVGSGPKNRLLKEDIHDFVKQRLNQPQSNAIESLPIIDFSQFGPIERVKMSKIHRLTARNMTRSWLNVPHVTQFDHADITDLEAFRKDMKSEAEQRSVRLTLLPFILKACAQALRQYPQFNMSLDSDDEHLVYKHYVHIGVAVDTRAGLVVPVLQNVDQKTIWQLADEVTAVVQKAQDEKLVPKDMQGGCFTISSLGSIGGSAFTPIVNTPEVAILGISKAEIQPRWDGSVFQPRLMMPLSLSYDHRAVNGADSARFTTYLAQVLADIRHLLMG